MDHHGDTADLSQLPPYLQATIHQLGKDLGQVPLHLPYGPPLREIKLLCDPQQQYTHLLLARHRLTEQLSNCPGLSPELILRRAAVYEALGYNELALADAYVSYTLCEIVLEGTDISDLEPTGLNGNPWPPLGDNAVALAHKYRSLILLCRSALILGCQHQAKLWIDDLLDLTDASQTTGEKNLDAEQDAVVADFCDFFAIYREDGSFQQSVSELRRNPKPTLFGQSQRQVYPWNEHEPNRMSRGALEEINTKLREVADGLEVEISVLPNLTSSSSPPNETERPSHPDRRTSGSTPSENSSQLGLFAKRDLSPGSTILEERSVLTAIRPHGEALCDACAANMESIHPEDRFYCTGCNIPFCSEACYLAAKRKYHTSNDEDDETDEGYPPANSPFCPGTHGNEDIHILGRAEGSTTPEWDLYFLLLSRTMQMAETQKVHPLDLFEIKYLWGDFSPVPELGNRPAQSGPKTLPYCVRHHVELPLQWFEVLMHSREECRPYSAHWLKKYDWWIIQTLFAKFRGVADAQQSTWTGKPEVAAVHPLWCLANHSCNPNVTWKPSGVRSLTVVKERIWQPGGSENNVEWTGIKAGEEIWNHYTDIHEKDFRRRRDRLQAVLGGDCRCERCTVEASLAEWHHDENAAVHIAPDPRWLE
ncbi:uncharacterized protein Z518_06255 [Rhinocladiella mackenziei CBS 650.93]|uniref:SET domain-containing protein n=1 Tax=Rhinocladiella mackenziei CBS 650.93 TaxID=1442369 RepID=A0A0D2H4P5_9EURO|nr:uncharacterized protein Z518_06255 [Rhinocladiella mackenziei CBS 650.93]KIX05383.1 hypothetical protein Z518_06255 [Rhinocladiella mackenziei CBS 650.93]